MKLESYEDIMNPGHSALDLAAMIGGSATRWSRNTWRKRLRKMGERRFRLELYYYWNELRKGEAPRKEAARMLRMRYERYKKAFQRLQNRLLALSKSPISFRQSDGFMV